MPSRTLRPILASSTVLALSISILSATGAHARGPAGSAGSCDGDCAVDQAQSQQQIRARDGSGAQAQPRAGGRAGQWPQRGRPVQQGSAWSQGWLSDTTPWARGNAQRGPGEGVARAPGACAEDQLEMGTLNDEQTATLRFMANEEKLAHDVYQALGELYDLPVFERIASSEAQHQAAMNTLMERYEIDGSPDELAPGEYTDSETDFAALYQSLVERGSQSLAEAIAVGIFIEEDDIAALAAAMEGLEEAAPDVYNVYSHLGAASERHLAAFQNAASQNAA